MILAEPDAIVSGLIVVDCGCCGYFFNKHAKGDADILFLGNKNILLDNHKAANVINNC